MAMCRAVVFFSVYGAGSSACNALQSLWEPLRFVRLTNIMLEGFKLYCCTFFFH